VKHAWSCGFNDAVDEPLYVTTTFWLQCCVGCGVGVPGPGGGKRTAVPDIVIVVVPPGSRVKLPTHLHEPAWSEPKLSHAGAGSSFGPKQDWPAKPPIPVISSWMLLRVIGELPVFRIVIVQMTSVPCGPLPGLTDFVISGGVGVLVGVSVGVLVGVFVGVLVGVFVGVLVGVLLGVILGVLVGVLVGVFVGVLVGVLLGVIPGVLVAVGVTGVGVLVGVYVLVGGGGSGVFGVSVGVSVGGSGVLVGVLLGGSDVLVGVLLGITGDRGVLVGVLLGATVCSVGVTVGPVVVGCAVLPACVGVLEASTGSNVLVAEGLGTLLGVGVSTPAILVELVVGTLVMRGAVGPFGTGVTVGRTTTILSTFSTVGVGAFAGPGTTSTTAVGTLPTCTGVGVSVLWAISVARSAACASATSGPICGANTRVQGL
jgi:hypothetical protein